MIDVLGNAILERVYIKGWEEESLSEAVEEATQLLEVANTALRATGRGESGTLAAALLRQLAGIGRKDPDGLIAQLRGYRAPSDVERSHWETLRDLLESELDVETLCEALQRRYADPTSVLLHYVDVLTEDERADHLTAPEDLYRVIRPASRALLYLGASAGLSYILRHYRLLTIGNLDEYHVPMKRSGAALDALAAEHFEELHPVGRYSLLAVFDNHGVDCPMIRAAALRGDPDTLTYRQQQSMIEMLVSGVTQKLHACLDAALVECSRVATEEARQFVRWAMYRLVVHLNEDLTAPQAVAAFALGLNIPKRPEEPAER